VNHTLPKDDFLELLHLGLLQLELLSQALLHS